MTSYNAADEPGESCRWPDAVSPPLTLDIFKGAQQPPQSPPRQAPHDNSVGYWLGHMSGHLGAFKEAPSETRKAALLAALNEYREAVSKGLKMPMNVPQPLRFAQSFSDWYHRQLDEALIQYRLDPSSTRLDAMQQHLKGFQDAVAMGTVKPW